MSTLPGFGMKPLVFASPSGALKFGDELPADCARDAGGADAAHNAAAHSTPTSKVLPADCAALFRFPFLLIFDSKPPRQPCVTEARALVLPAD
ncbi:MAG: hypothetical protein WCD76_01280 [Pyrinomonadaceae bacterium]